jgi:hypothetical protein
MRYLPGILDDRKAVLGVGIAHNGFNFYYWGKADYHTGNRFMIDETGMGIRKLKTKISSIISQYPVDELSFGDQVPETVKKYISKTLEKKNSATKNK